MESGTEKNAWCRTTFGDGVKTTFTWTIENFKNRNEKFGDPISSSLISVTGSDNKVTKWCFLVYPKGRQANNKECVCVFLKNMNYFNVRASWDGWLLDENARKMNAMVGDSMVVKKGHLIGSPDFMKQIDMTDNLLPGGNLTLFFEITVYSEGKTLSGSKDSEDTIISKKDRSLLQLSDHLGQVLEDQEFSDVEILCDGSVFPCHQIILAARSPVFRAMLQADMKEKQTRKIDIEDSKPEIVGEMLRFIYTGDIPNEKLDALASDLLGTSDKYELNYLKKICEDKLCSTLKVDNSIECLVLGDLHNASKLKKMALELVAKNMSKIVETDVYKNLFIQRPLLAWELSKVNVQEETS